MNEEKTVCPICCQEDIFRLSIMLYGARNIKVCEKCEQVNKEGEGEPDE